MLVLDDKGIEKLIRWHKAVYGRIETLSCKWNSESEGGEMEFGTFGEIMVSDGELGRLRDENMEC